MYTSQLMRILLLDLLDLAQMENNTFKMNFCDINLFDIFTKSFAIVQHYASLKHITFETEFKEQEQHLFRRLLGDERRYMQILINFLSNAIKFSRERGRIVVELRIDSLQIKSQGSDQ